MSWTRAFLSAAALVVIASGCQEKRDDAASGAAEPSAPAATEPAGEPPAAVIDAALAPRPITDEGAILLDAGSERGRPAVWAIGGGEILFVATASAAGGARVTMRQDEETREVWACERLELARGDKVTAYRSGPSVVFIVCETHGADAGISQGVRLVWNPQTSAVQQRGTFENEGPPAFDSMDFDEGSFGEGDVGDNIEPR